MLNNETVFVATCLFGLERLVGEEIDALGGRRLETIDGRVKFSAPLSKIPELNINLRFAERLLIEVGSCPAPDFDTLFEGVRAMCWEKYIGKNDIFPVKEDVVICRIHNQCLSRPDGDIQRTYVFFCCLNIRDYINRFIHITGKENPLSNGSCMAQCFKQSGNITNVFGNNSRSGYRF